ncbi:MAG: DNA/RNA nuclease SfsA [Candidatus Hodarchaeota archaeon]
MHSNKLPIFKIPELKRGFFLDRPNRFVSEIKYQDKIELAHIHDSGRLKELLIPGKEILFTFSKGKLKYYVKAVKSENEWVIIDTSLHSRIALKIFKYLPKLSKVKEIKKEVPIGKSRIDFFLDGVPLEVKGVTLVKDKIALFPDAPTERGRRHIQEIIDHKGLILFLIFKSALQFGPNYEIDPDFAEKLSEAREKNITILTAQISFDGTMLYYNGSIPLLDF